MRHKNISAMLRVFVLGFAFAAIAAFSFASQAKADDNGNVPPLSQAERLVGSVRAGAYYFANSYMKNLVQSPVLNFGIEGIIDEETNVSRTSITADYISSSSNGNSIRLIPIQIENQWFQVPWNKMSPYVVVGAGFALEKLADNTNLKSGTSDSFAGGIGAGLLFKNDAFVELKYQYIGSTMDEQFSGWQLEGGFTF